MKVELICDALYIEGEFYDFVFSAAEFNAAVHDWRKDNNLYRKALSSRRDHFEQLGNAVLMCEYCGELFEATQTLAKYCCHNHRIYARRRNAM